MRLPSRRLLPMVCLLSTSPVLTGCGLTFGGTRQVVHATASPVRATVVTGGEGVEFMTPAALSLERRNNYTLTFSAPGYASQRVELRRSIRGGIVVLDVVLGLVPVVVDAATGAWYRLSPEAVDVCLLKVDADAAGPDRIAVQVALRSGRDSTEVRVGGAPGAGVVVRVAAH